MKHSTEDNPGGLKFTATGKGGLSAPGRRQSLRSRKVPKISPPPTLPTGGGDLSPAALAFVSYGVVLDRVRVRGGRHYDFRVS